MKILLISLTATVSQKALLSCQDSHTFFVNHLYQVNVSRTIYWLYAYLWYVNVVCNSQLSTNRTTNRYDCSSIFILNIYILEESSSQAAVQLACSMHCLCVVGFKSYIFSLACYKMSPRWLCIKFLFMETAELAAPRFGWASDGSHVKRGASS